MSTPATAPHHAPASSTRSSHHALELVVARYEESLGWLRKVPAAFRITIYDKGASGGSAAILPGFKRGEGGERVSLVALPNVGREAHTYLHHIASRLRAERAGLAGLAGVTVFCQGRPFDHAYDFHHTLRSLAQDNAGSLGPWLWLGHTIDTDTCDGALFRAWSKNKSGEGLGIDGFHRALLGSAGPEEYAFVLGGQFAARSSALQGRGLPFWERALDLSTSWPQAAHCFERCWSLTLGLPGPGPELMAGRRTIHLKMMRGDKASG